MRPVTHHHSGLDGDVNGAITLTAHPAGPGGASAHYVARYVADHGVAEADLSFLQLRDPFSVFTNEVLLAIVQDRLEGFQEGQFPCPENEMALAYLRRSLECLKQRTRRRLNQRIAGQHVEPLPVTRETAMSETRVCKNDTHLRINVGAEGCDILLTTLQTWRGWQYVESAVKTLVAAGGPLTESEMGVIKGCAVNTAGQNGLREFLAAYGQLAAVSRTPSTHDQPKAVADPRPHGNATGKPTGIEDPSAGVKEPTHDQKQKAAQDPATLPEYGDPYD